MTNNSLTDNYKGVFDGRIGFGKRPALLIVDFINAYITEGAPLYAPDVVSAVHETVDLLSLAHEKNIPVLYTKVLYNKNFRDGGIFIQKVPVLKTMVEGEPLAEIVPPLSPIDSDIIIVKQYASAFFGTSLAATLTSLGVDTILLTGCSTSGCVRASAVDGMQYGFRVIVPRECVGDRHPGPHEANLFDINSKYGDVVSKNEVMEYLKQLVGFDTPSAIASGYSTNGVLLKRKIMKALNGIRILDLTHMLSGPYSAMMLADLGAETIKVEPPKTGEGTRRLLERDPANSLNGFGAYYMTLNRNKKSVTLDLKSEKGLEIFYELVKTADIVISNFSAGVTKRLKVDYETLSKINPRIITCTVTGFDETGPGKDRTAFDMVAQAMGGNMSITGQPGNPPTRAGFPIGDLAGGLMATIGVLAALNARHLTGRGQHVDISMLDAQISLLNYMATMHFLSGIIPDKLGNGHFVHVPYDSFTCSDGYIIIAIIADNFWEALLTVIPADDLNTEEHKYQPGRLKNKELINRRLNEIFSTNTQKHWLEILQSARIPCAPVNNVQQAVNDEQVLFRNMIVEVQHPNGGSTRMPGNPIKLSDTHEETFTPPPLLGQHNEEVFSMLGLSPADIEALQTAGII